ncbi:MAG: HK97 family phage prohead protease [Candidatus Omnitrophica bacterium]|nr:HK97 family phage prohead protease [Candidatus Omnitrophota bacterium]
MSRETRTFNFSIEKRDDDEGTKIVGHAAVFNEATDIGGMFREQVAPGAFKESIKADDVRALFNHDPNFVLGRNVAGTLRMSEDKKGLAIEIDPPDTQTARDLEVSMRRGDITQMSFAFQVKKETWEEGEEGESDLRTLQEVRLFDVSPVTFPAYDGTDVAVRSRKDWMTRNRRSRVKRARKIISVKRRAINAY